MIKLINILNEILTEKKLCKKGKAYYNRRIAAGEKPSAYLSGRAVKVCKGLMEEIKASEAHYDNDAIQTVIDGKRDLGFISLKTSTITKDNFWDLINNNNLKVLKIPSNPYEAYVYYRPGAESKANELKDIAEKYDGYLAYNASDKDSRRIGELLGYDKKDIDNYIEKNKRIVKLSL